MDQHELHLESRPSPLTLHERMVLYFTARLFDFHLWALGVAAIWLGVMRGSAFERDALLPALCVILPMLAGLMGVDALVHALWGTTPGHRLLGISLTTREGAPLTFAAHLRRNGAIWLRQLACFVPPFYLWTLLFSYYRIRSGKPWRYDERRGYRVTIRPVSQRRMMWFCLALFTTSLLILALAGAIVRMLLRQYGVM